MNHSQKEKAHYQICDVFHNNVFYKRHRLWKRLNTEEFWISFRW